MSQMNDELFLELVAKYLSQDISVIERKQLLEWVASSEDRRADFDEMIQLWSITNEYVEEPFEANTNAAWNKIDAALETTNDEKQTNEAKVISFNRYKIWIRVAAIFVFLGLGAWFFLDTDANHTIARLDIETGAEERKKWDLPDGSTVWLNENSKLKFVDSVGINQRWVSLEGEAFFDVKRDETKPFVIHSGDAVTTVLGTSFNVRAYPEEVNVEVSVETGKVRLERVDDRQEQVQLLAGNTGLYERTTEKVLKKEVKSENVNSWRTGKLTFSDVPVQTIVETLERHFGENIELSNPAIGNCIYKLEEQDADLDLILGMMAFGLDLEVNKTDSKIVISGDGKNCPKETSKN